MKTISVVFILYISTWPTWTLGDIFEGKGRGNNVGVYYTRPIFFTTTTARPISPPAPTPPKPLVPQKSLPAVRSWSYSIGSNAEVKAVLKTVPEDSQKIEGSYRVLYPESIQLHTKYTADKDGFKPVWYLGKV